MRAVSEAVVMLTPMVKATLFTPTPTTPTPRHGDEVPPLRPTLRTQDAQQPQEQKACQGEPECYEGQRGDPNYGVLDRHEVGAQEEDRKEQRGLRQQLRPALALGHGPDSTPGPPEAQSDPPDRLGGSQTDGQSCRVRQPSRTDPSEWITLLDRGEQILPRGGEGQAHVTFAELAESAAGRHGHVLALDEDLANPIEGKPAAETSAHT